MNPSERDELLIRVDERLAAIEPKVCDIHRELYANGLTQKVARTEAQLKLVGGVLSASTTAVGALAWYLLS